VFGERKKGLGLQGGELHDKIKDLGDAGPERGGRERVGERGVFSKKSGPSHRKLRSSKVPGRNRREEHDLGLGTCTTGGLGGLWQKTYKRLVTRESGVEKTPFEGKGD